MSTNNTITKVINNNPLADVDIQPLGQGRVKITAANGST